MCGTLWSPSELLSGCIERVLVVVLIGVLNKVVVPRFSKPYHNNIYVSTGPIIQRMDYENLLLLLLD